MNITCIIFGVIFVSAGVLFAAGKLHPYLSAWKHMTREEKEKIKILPLCRNIGEMILLSGIIFLIKGFCASFQERWFSAAVIAWLIIACLDIWFISKSKRYINQ